MGETNPSFEADAVLLDLDGTMVLSTESIENAWKAWTQKFGLAWQMVLPAVHGRTAVETIRLVIPDLPEDVVEREANEVNERQTHDETGVAPVAGMQEFVTHFLPNLWAVVTSCPSRANDGQLESNRGFTKGRRCDS